LAGKTKTSRIIIDCPYCGKMLPKGFWHEKEKDERIIIKCPCCGAFKPWKSGKRHLPSGTFQRYKCRKRGHRFSDSEPLDT
jgi:endogenous inhibitor of DNA gyrase (YacG/DUF329 family)